VHRARPLRVFLLYRVDNRIRAYSARTAPFRASAEVLANYRDLQEYTVALHGIFGKDTRGIDEKSLIICHISWYISNRRLYAAYRKAI
jgi:hypothetical protein